MIPHTAMLLADVMGWVQGLLPVVILLLVVFYIVGEKKLKDQRMAQRKQPTLNQPPADRQRAAAPNRAPRPVRNEEIEEFLRRAAQQRGEPSAAQRSAAARAQAKPERLTGTSAAPRPREGPAPAKPIVEAKAGAAQRPPSSFSKGVTDRLSTKQFDARASDLSGDINRHDLEREQRLKKTFDHQIGALGQLGALSDTTSKAATQAAAAAGAGKPAADVGAALIGLLKSGSLPQAFVLSEIFNRPEDRW